MHITRLLAIAASPLLCLPLLHAGPPRLPPTYQPLPALKNREPDEVPQAVPGTGTQRPYLLGDWGGERQKMQDHGFTSTLTYVSDIQGNPVGGQSRGIAQAGSMGLTLKFELEKLAHIKGLEFFTSGVWRNGTNLSSDKIKNQFPVAQVFGGSTYRLNELYFKETLFDGHLTLKAGRLDTGNDFLQSDLYYYYVSNAFDGNPISIFFNSGFFAYPNATWGGYLAFKPIDQIQAQFGIYNMNPSIKKNQYHGANFTFKDPDGVMLIGQVNYMLNQGPKDEGLPGNYKVGYFYQTGEKTEFSGKNHKGNYSYYFLLDQMLYHKGHSSITPFVALIFAPPNRNLFPFFFDCGVIYDGIIKGRPDDALVFGAAYGSYSPNLRTVQRQARHNKILGPFGDEPQDFELILEMNYWWQITKWFVVTPDVQYIIHPKGHPYVEDALVLGAQVGVTF